MLLHNNYSTLRPPVLKKGASNEEHHKNQINTKKDPKGLTTRVGWLGRLRFEFLFLGTRAVQKFEHP